jgi:YaiO family outer membrane protein
MFVALVLTTLLAGSAAGAQGGQVPTQVEAEELARQGNREAALAAFRRRAAENPADLNARLAVARLHAQMGRPDLAEPVYRSVMLEAPENVEAIVGVGTSLVSLHRVDEALVILDRAARLDGKNADVLAALGAAHLQAYNLTLGLSYLESAVSAAPTGDHRQALEDARRAHGHHVTATAFWEDFNQDIPSTTNGNLVIDYRLADRFRVMARGQYQEKFDVPDQRGGLGFEWRWHPQVTLHVHALAGPGNDVLPQADAFVQLAQATPAGWNVSYRYVGFERSNVSVFSPGVGWLGSRARAALSYSLAITNYDGVADADDGHTGSLDSAYRVQPRVWLTLGYTYGVDDFDTLSVDRIGRFRAHTAKGGFQIDLATLTSLTGRYDYQWREGDTTMQRIWVSLAQSF